MGFAAPPPISEQAPEPAEIESAVGMLHIVRIFAVIFGVLAFLIGLIYAAVVSSVYNSCVSAGGIDCSSLGGFAALFVALAILGALINFIIFIATGRIRTMVYEGEYDMAKSSLLIWTIVGFLLGGILIGIFLLVAYIKMDPLINWQGNVAPVLPGTAGGYSPSSLDQLPLPPPPPDTPVCSRCGKPTTFIPQYGRYYCFSDRLYVPRS